MGELLYKDLTYQIRAALFNVFNTDFPGGDFRSCNGQVFRRETCRFGRHSGANLSGILVRPNEPGNFV